jgi:hypothetical protein
MAPPRKQPQRCCRGAAARSKSMAGHAPRPLPPSGTAAGTQGEFAQIYGGARAAERYCGPDSRRIRTRGAHARRTHTIKGTQHIYGGTRAAERGAVTDRRPAASRRPSGRRGAAADGARRPAGPRDAAQGGHGRLAAQGRHGPVWVPAAPCRCNG